MPDYQQILIGDTAIEYMRLDGAVDKPSIVLLHEGLGCVALWRDFPQLLHDICGYSVIAYSRAGYGGSSAALLPRPIDHMRREAQVFLPDFLAAMGVKQAIFLGHSDGATVALEAAAARLPALDALILIAPHVFVEDFALVAIRTMNERFSEDNLREKLRRYHGSNVDIAFRGWCDTWLDPEFKHWSMESELEKINLPILQFQGLNDEYGSRAHVDSIERLARGRVETHLMPECGHAPHGERPQQVLDTISRFLNR